MLSSRPLPTFASELHCQASHLCVFSLLYGPAILYTHCPVRSAWLAPFHSCGSSPRSHPCSLQRGVDWERKSSLLGERPRGKEERVPLWEGRQWDPHRGLPEGALWEVWKERDPAAQGRD